MNNERKKRLLFGLIVATVSLLAIAAFGLAVHQALLESRISEQGVRFQDFPDLAAAFWNGETSLPVEMIRGRTYSDGFVWQNRLYWPFGPLPALLLMPLIPFFGTIFPTTVVTFLLLFLAAVLVFAIARRHGLKDKDSVWLAVAYSAGSAVAPLAIPIATSWGVILVANIFLLAALYSHVAKRPTWLTGIFLALAVTARPMSVLGLLLYILYRTLKDKKNLTKKILSLLIPLVLASAVIGAYNFARFSDPLQTGYRFQWDYNPDLVERMEYGTNDLRYLPSNLWYFLVAPPEVIKRFPFVVPEHMGMALLFSCPYLIYLFIYWRRWRKFAPPLAAAAIGLLPALTYYASGFTQIGYRYAVDVYPLIFLALIIAFNGHLPRPAKALIALSVMAHICWMVVFFT